MCGVYGAVLALSPGAAGSYKFISVQGFWILVFTGFRC